MSDSETISLTVKKTVKDNVRQPNEYVFKFEDGSTITTEDFVYALQCLINRLEN